MAEPTLDNEAYYDTFADWYEKERGYGYHKLIDDLQVDLVAGACRGRDVLEVGCGTGALLQRIAPLSRSAMGIDISAGMLAQARERGLECVQGTATEMPFEDASFDVAYSFKVLAHIEEIRGALLEISRVLRPGGRAFLEFYNRASLRYLAKRVGGPGAIAADNTDEGAVFTRWDYPSQCAEYLPPGLREVGSHGVRVFVPVAAAMRVPLVSGVLRRAERFARSRFPFTRFGGFYVLEAVKD